MKKKRPRDRGTVYVRDKHTHDSGKYLWVNSISARGFALIFYVQRYRGVLTIKIEQIGKQANIFTDDKVQQRRQKIGEECQECQE